MVDRKVVCVLTFPALIILIAAVIFPLIFSINVSLRKYDLRLPLKEYPFIEINNFLRAVYDTYFLSSLLITLKFVLMGLALQFPIGLGVAILLSRLSWSAIFCPQ